MPSPLLSLFTGRSGTRRAVQSVEPQRTFADVVLPPRTRQTLDQALAQVRNHALIFGRWGLGERHVTGLGLAFNFAGPPGTGKTICAEAIAHALNKKLFVVNYAEVESMWMGETPKNVATVFRLAAEEDAVLFFDEADAIASRRSAGASQPNEREANTVVNVLLRELETFNGVVVFATNLAANFDPAFERRIRTHVLFEMPGVDERERIWHVQVHPTRTPLAADVDFRALAERHAVSGGDIKNAVLKAAAAAAGEAGPDADKRIHQHHFERAVEDVIAAKAVMQQTLFRETSPAHAELARRDEAIGEALARRDEQLNTAMQQRDAAFTQALAAAEARWRGMAVGALAVAAAALLAAATALGALLLR
jgi:SpoVK/Ycf46/Vps4 family AAA+-type ATPase